MVIIQLLKLKWTNITYIFALILKDRIMLRGLPFKQMLVLTRPWALPNFGLGLVVLHDVHLSLKRSFVLFRDDLVATVRKFYTRCTCIGFIYPI
jgi:hypothetical protein